MQKMGVKMIITWPWNVYLILLWWQISINRSAEFPDGIGILELFVLFFSQFVTCSSAIVVWLTVKSLAQFLLIWKGYGGLLKLFSSCFISEMVDLGGYVIILVETHDKKVKLYGKWNIIFYLLHNSFCLEGP